MVVFWREMMLARKGIVKPDSPLMSSEAPCIAGGLFINYL